MTITRITPSEPIGTKPTDVLIERNSFKATVSPLSIRGIVWVYKNMMCKYLGDCPSIDLEAVDEVARMIELDKLIVEVR